ncbi:MAG: CDP-diacylglycerol--glycerol-3-phosphate 3-phosphatidyltransferase [Oscillospiraceae bacterium]|nr:CDP-diacylglycerol--glycerol-3-phosphate 3-phosphatidyltransferase [Oscillospiraceae bacterium]
MNTPNKLTLIRVALIPVFLIVLYIGFPGSNYAAMAIFIAAGLTDIADGYLARKNGQVTDFGKFTDPLADKVLVVAAMLWFVEQGTMPAWAALIVIVREFMVTALRLAAIGNGRVIAAGVSGKLKTVVTIVCLTVMFLELQVWMVYACIGAISVTTLVSGIEYFIRNKDVLKMK